MKKTIIFLLAMILIGSTLGFGFSFAEPVQPAPTQTDISWLGAFRESLIYKNAAKAQNPMEVVSEYSGMQVETEDIVCAFDGSYETKWTKAVDTFGNLNGESSMLKNIVLNDDATVSTNIWAVFDLGVQENIKSFLFVNELNVPGYYSSEFAIQLSQDAENWQTVYYYKRTTEGYDPMHAVLLESAVEARYIRLLVVRGQESSTGHLRLHEFCVFDSTFPYDSYFSDEMSNLSGRKNILTVDGVQSVKSTGFAGKDRPEKAYDGLLDTKWACQTSDITTESALELNQIKNTSKNPFIQHYIEFELKTTVNINAYAWWDATSDAWNAHNRFAEYTQYGNYTAKEWFVQISTDGTNWTIIHEISKNISPALHIELNQTYEARYIRLCFVNSGPANATVRLTELAFYEAEKIPDVSTPTTDSDTNKTETTDTVPTDTVPADNVPADNVPTDTVSTEAPTASTDDNTSQTGDKTGCQSLVGVGKLTVILIMICGAGILQKKKF